MKNNKRQSIHGNTGKVRTPEMREKISKNNARYWLGKKRPPHTEEVKKKISESKQGQTVWNKGLKGYRAGEQHHWFGRDMSGESNPYYKGDNVGYRGLHLWVQKELGKATECQSCGKVGSGRQIHWANKSHEYQRVLSDWLQLCVKCHKAYDTNKLNLISIK